MFKKDGTISIEKVLKDEYNYTYTNLEDLYTQDFIELEGNGVDALLWIKYKDEKYLFKPMKQFEYNVWGEILSEELAKDMDIECAEYRIATLDNMKGVLTKSFVKENERLKLGSELLQDYIRKNKDEALNKRINEILKDKSIDQYQRMKNVFKMLNNYEDVSRIITNSSKFKEEEKESLKENIKDKLFFHILTMQGDKHSNNWGIIKEDGYYKTAQSFDNAASFGLSYPQMNGRIRDFKNDFMTSRHFDDTEILNKYTATPLMFSYHSRKDNEPPKIVLSDMIDSLSPNEVERYQSYIKRFDIDYLDNIINMVEVKNGCKMDEELRFYVLNVYETNRQNLAKTFSKKAGKKNER